MTSPPGLRIAIVGANGQLGTDLMSVLADLHPVPLTHGEMDVSARGAVEEIIESLRAQIVINTAAYNRVDECESDPDGGFLVNATGPYNLARACARTGATLVHFSTDYVFDGSKNRPYTEEDPAKPISAYGITKLAGEHFVRYALDQHIIIRTCGLYGKAGSRGKGGNFVESMLKLARDGKPIRVVDDQVVSPTYTYDLALKVRDIILSGECGLYHVTNSGACTWYQFAQRIFEISGLATDLSPTTSSEFGSVARRPSYSVLANTRLQQLQLGCLRSWQVALAAYLQS